jgi:predicted outer membrane lipoprotein
VCVPLGVGRGRPPSTPVEKTRASNWQDVTPRCMLSDMSVTKPARSGSRLRIELLAGAFGLVASLWALHFDERAQAAVDPEPTCVERRASLHLPADQLQEAEAMCGALGGSRCGSGVVTPAQAVCTAEWVALGGSAADELGLVMDHERTDLVWQVRDRDSGATVELDARTGQVLGWTH